MVGGSGRGPARPTAAGRRQRRVSGAFTNATTPMSSPHPYAKPWDREPGTTTPRPSQPTPAHHPAGLWTTIRQYLPRQTVCNYRWVLERYVFPVVGRVRLVSLTPQHVRDMLAATTARAVSPRTVQLSRSTLRVQRTVQRLGKDVGMIEGAPKTLRSRRTVPLPHVCVGALREHHARQVREVQKAGSAWRTHGLVFASTRGTVVEPRNFNRLFDALVAAAEVRRIRNHDLRHTYATLLLAQDASPRVAMELLGHSQLSMTTDLYGHVMPTTLRAAADAADRLFEP